MQKFEIIWDFDGTLYPLQPYDSEQTLLLLRLGRINGTGRVLRKSLIRMLIHADMQQWFKGRTLRKIYALLYGWSLKGSPVSLLDRAARKIAATISKRERQAFHRIKASGFQMHIISCGTLDLVERILVHAGLSNCFATVQANPLRIHDGAVAGVKPVLITARDKLYAAMQLYGQNRCSIMAVGDGYTDIPLLDWVDLPVMIDRDHLGRARYAAKPYHFVASVEALEKVLL